VAGLSGGEYGAGGICPPDASRRGAKRDAVIFATRNIQKYVSFVEPGMGMEGQIMCEDNVHFTRQQ